MAKRKRPWLYALGGAGLALLAIYLWQNRYPKAKGPIRPELAAYIRQGDSTVQVQTATPVPTGQEDQGGIPYPVPFPSPTSPVPPTSSLCGCQKPASTPITWVKYSAVDRRPWWT